VNTKLVCRVSLSAWIVLLFLVVAASGEQSNTGPSSQSTYNADRLSFEPGELIVKFRDNASPESRERSHGRNRASILRRFSRLNADYIRLSPGQGIEEAMSEYKADPSVEYVEPNFRIYVEPTEAVSEPNDAYFQDQWHLENTGQTGGTPEADIDALSAWTETTGSPDVIVAVLDSGIAYRHEDLQANMWVNRLEIPDNGIDDDQNGYVDDVYGIDTYAHTSDPDDALGHGTHVAGIIGAMGNNGIGVTGINWKVQLLSCRFLGPWGYGSISGAIECLEYVKALYDRGENIVITNNSWGFTGFSQLLYDVVADQRDILMVAAAGNNWRDNDELPYSPASLPLPNVIAVASTDHNDGKAPSSSFGRRSVHVGAPGVDILSTLPEYTHWGASDYGYLSGTSMAAPQVAGIAALIKAAEPKRNFVDIRNLILSGGERISALEGITVTGRRVNAYGSLTCKKSPVFSVLQAPDAVVPGKSVILSALNIDCEKHGPFVRVETGAGEIVKLRDDGLWPDMEKHDGIFAAEWIPMEPAEVLRFYSNQGEEETILLN